MIEVQQRRILIDGRPEIILAGEVHYFRLQREEWADRIRKTRDAGCTAIASYSPWVAHEFHEGRFDFGEQTPTYDLGAFIDLVHAHGMRFIARPGPFIMAEVKNEGIPYWVYAKHPEAKPITWEGETGRSKTLDILDPGFLASARRYYARIMPILAGRLIQNGGPIIACQLDNEIGMLSWVNNQPELNEGALCLFSEWLGSRYSDAVLKARYPFDLFDPEDRAAALRRPEPAIAAAFHRDWGDFCRFRIASYIRTLRGYAEEDGVRGIPFIVNIHGTGGGRLYGLPIGISQLMESYTQDEGYLSGSDHYLEGFTRSTGPDLYVMNAFMDAVHRPEQPLTSLEFSAGSQDYGESGGHRDSRSDQGFKVRLSLAQGNRLINYYLMAGGRNPMLPEPVGDGNDRIAFTGERHGFAAPINPEGVLDPTWHGLKDVHRAINPVREKLAVMEEEHDRMALAFAPDWWKADYKYGPVMEEIVQELEWMREPLYRLSRFMLWCGLRYTARDIQNRPLDPAIQPGLAAASPGLMDGPVQEKLAAYVQAGGRLLIYGDFPDRDLELKPCTILAEALGLRIAGKRQDSSHLYLSVRGEGLFSFEPEVRIWSGRAFSADPRQGETLLRIVHTGEPVAAACEAGRGRAVVIASPYVWHKRVYQEALKWLGCEPKLVSDAPFDGVIHTTQRSPDGERFLTILNVDDEEKSLTLRENGRALFDGRPLELAGREGRLLPLGVRFGTMTVEWATAEIVGRTERSLTFRGTSFSERIRLSGPVRVSRGRVEGGAVITEPGRDTVVSWS